jgi:hypothetical protein
MFKKVYIKKINITANGYVRLIAAFKVFGEV